MKTTKTPKEKKFAVAAKREATLHPKVVKWILESYPKAWVYKTHDTTTRGIPDICAICDGMPVWIELKIGHVLTPIQRYTLDQIRLAGGIALVMCGEEIGFLYDYNMETHKPHPGRFLSIKEYSLKQVIGG